MDWGTFDERIRAHLNEESRWLAAMVGDCIGKLRQKDRDHVIRVHDKLLAAVDKLREEFRIGMGRVPIAKAWDADEVCHTGDVVSFGGETFQCLQDTGTASGGVKQLRRWASVAKPPDA